MAMTKAEIQHEMSRVMSTYATKKRRSELVLSNALAVLGKQAKLARLSEGEFDQIVRAEADVALSRIARDATSLQPVVFLDAAASRDNEILTAPVFAKRAAVVVDGLNTEGDKWTDALNTLLSQALRSGLDMETCFQVIGSPSALGRCDQSGETS